MKIRFFNRDFSDRAQPGLDADILLMSFDRQGGCKELRLVMTGNRDDVLAMLNDLRCPVEVYDDAGLRVWWGYVFACSVADGAVIYENSLDNLRNRVRTNYTQADGSTVYNTDWAENALSVETYGYRELQAVMSGVNEDVADLKRDSILSQFASPTASFNLAGSLSSDVNVTLICRGWKHTLSWQYVDSVPPVVGVEYADLGTIGDDVDDIVYQQFTVPAGSNQTMREVAIYANMYALDGVSFPTDNLLVAIYALSGGAPTGAALATATITPAMLTGYAGVYAPTEAERIVVAFASPVELTAGTQYALQLSRSSGAQYANSYFVVNTNSDKGYSGGVYRFWDAGGAPPGWAVASPDVDMVFTLYSDEWEGVARQIKEVLDAYAQFIEGITDLSGCLDSEVQTAFPGDTTAWEVLGDYLALGGTNGRALTLSIDAERKISVVEEPASADGFTYLLDREGNLLTKSGAMVELSDLWQVAGHYAMMQDHQFADMNAVPLAMIEEVSVSGGKVRVIFRGQIRVEDLADVFG